MRDALIQILMAAIGTLGFSIYFRVNEKNVLASTIGGALGWAIYLLINLATDTLFFSNFAAAMFVYLYAEIMARILKAPSNVFLIPGIIPLIPGGALYYTMSGVVNENKELFMEKGFQTLEISFGIAAGIVVGAIIVAYLTKLISKKKKAHNR